MATKKFRIRGLTSLLTTFSFLISLISGIVLYFTPQGKVAHWVHWTFWGLDKDTWGAIHINSSLVFFFAAVYHTYLNWNVLLGYIRKKATGAFNLKTETLVALFLSVFIVVASLYDIQPFGTIMKWNEDIKDYWASKADSEPPIPHAEAMTVTEFCQKLNIPIQRFAKRAEEYGWDVKSNDDTIEEIARRSKIAPADIYKALQVVSSSGYGTGWGRKTLQQVCDELAKDPSVALEKLAAKGVKAQLDNSIRDISNGSNLKPIDIVNIISDGAVQVTH